MFKKFLLIAAAVIGTTAAQATTIEMVVAFPPGGVVDILGRDVSRVLTNNGIPTVVVNRPGAGGRVGTHHVATQADANSTLLMLPTGPGLYDPILSKDVNYNVLTDFEPVIAIVKLPVVILVPANSKYQTIEDLLADIRNPSAKLNWGHTSMAFRTETLRLLDTVGARANIVDVPFNGGAPVMQNLAGGHLDFAVLDLVGAASHIESKTVRALAITTKQRNSALPDVPTFIEKKIQHESFSWVVLVARKGMSDDLVRKINAAVNKDLPAEVNPSVKNAKLILGTPEDAKKFIHDQYRIMTPIIRKFAAPATQ
jgi:tripartite-type tricarboxylate transporter receptor subunit TctC